MVYMEIPVMYIEMQHEIDCQRHSHCYKAMGGVPTLLIA
jgi:hypothetical protein